VVGGIEFTSGKELELDKTSPSRDQEPRWIKASKSVGVGACIELTIAGGMLRVRDSKHPQVAPLSYTWAEFEAFLDGAKKGEFDELAQRLTIEEERAKNLPLTGVTNSIDTWLAALTALRPTTTLGWINASISVVAMLIVSLSLLTGIEVLHTPGGAFVTLAALFLLTASRRLHVFRGRHLNG